MSGSANSVSEHLFFILCCWSKVFVEAMPLLASLISDAEEDARVTHSFSAALQSS
jgi:hypothetical protein